MAKQDRTFMYQLDTTHEAAMAIVLSEISFLIS